MRSLMLFSSASMLSTLSDSSGSNLEQAVTQVGLMIMFISVSSWWIIRLIHDPNSIVSIYYGVVDEMTEWAEWRNGRNGWNGQNGGNGGMAEWAEWQNGGMAEWSNGGNGGNSGNEGRNHECWYARKNGTMAEWQKWKPKYY